MFLNVEIFAQNSMISSIETEGAYGIGAGKYGGFLKINHNWIKKNRTKIYSGFSSAYFINKNELNTSIYNRIGKINDLHFNLHTGINYTLLKSNKLYTYFEAYFGYYFLHEKGSYKSKVSELYFEKNIYNKSDFIIDFGTRLAIGYVISNNILIQGSISNSFKEFEVFSGNKYSKIFFGFGLNYQLEKNSIP